MVKNYTGEIKELIDKYKEKGFEWGKPIDYLEFRNGCSKEEMEKEILDYDNVELNIIEEDYKFVQEKFKLPPAYLFGTKAGNYHLICLKKFLNGEIYNILLHTRCDENYKDSPIKNNYRSYVIRLSDKIGSKKPKFIKMMGYNLHRQYEISSAHLKLLSKLYKDIPKIEYSNEDKLDEVRLHKYETSI